MELVEVIAASGVDRAKLQPEPPIPWTEVAELARNDLLRFESHGVTHAAVSSLSDGEIDFEMRHSRDTVSEHTGRPCRHFAYPFGSRTSIGPRAGAIAARYYDSAVTMCLGRIDRADPWLLPRIPLYPRNSALFARLKTFSRYTPGALNRPPLREPSAASVSNA
jgi:hypothetical protein